MGRGRHWPVLAVMSVAGVALLVACTTAGPDQSGDAPERSPSGVPASPDTSTPPPADPESSPSSEPTEEPSSPLPSISWQTRQPSENSGQTDEPGPNRSPVRSTPVPSTPPRTGIPLPTDPTIQDK